VVEPGRPWDHPGWAVVRRHTNVAMFLAGFLFDILTMQRIDAWTDLAIQLLYLCGLTGLLVFQHREVQGTWRPPAWLAKYWTWHVEAQHFLYGGLLSAYVVLYFRSSTAARPLVFLALLGALLLLNEMPRVRSAGYHLRLGLHALCVVSFLNYFVPILLGRIDGVVFVLSLLLAAAIVWRVTDWLSPRDADRDRTRRRLFAPAATVLGVVALFHALGLIPPVPLSVQFHGIYHEVHRDAGEYALVYERPPARLFWRRDSRPFARRPGDRVHYFARVFAPGGFRHRVVIRWETWDEGRGWITTDRIPLDVRGGRAEGFRGSAVKANFGPGRWRVTAETADGRAIATLGFTVVDDARGEPRHWRTTRG
jgi:hypothetical protein